MISNIGDTRSLRQDSTIANPVVPWWIVACPALLFVVLALLSHGPNTRAVDLDVSRWIQARNPNWADPLASVGNTLGEAPVAIGLFIASLVIGAICRRWREIWFVLVIAVGRLLSVFFKGWFESPRPAAEQVRLHEAFDSYGFPSGHTLTATIVAGTLVYLIARQFPNPSLITLLGVCWLLTMASTAFARIWVGAHWLTDTLGSAMWGIFIVLVAVNASAILVNRWPGNGAIDSP